MTEHDMIEYLKGYLAARNSLSKEDIDFLSTKLEKVTPSWQFDPNMFRVSFDQQPFQPMIPEKTCDSWITGTTADNGVEA